MSTRLLLTVVSALFVWVAWQGDGLAQDKKESGGKTTSSPSDSKPAAVSSTRSKSTGISTKKKKIPSGGGTASPGAAQKQPPSAGTGNNRTRQPDISVGSTTKKPLPASTDKRQTETTGRERGAPAGKAGTLDDSLNERKKGAPAPQEEEAASPGELDAPEEGGTLTTQSITPEELDEFIEDNPDTNIQDADGDGDYEIVVDLDGLGDDVIVTVEDGYAYVDTNGDGVADNVVPAEYYDPDTNEIHFPVDTDSVNLSDTRYSFDYEPIGYVLEDRDGDGVPETYRAYDYDNDGIADAVEYREVRFPDEDQPVFGNVEPSGGGQTGGGTSPDVPPGGWAAGYEDGDELSVNEDTVPVCPPSGEVRWDVDPDATYEQVGDDIYVDTDGDNVADVIIPNTHITEDGYIGGGPPPTEVAEQGDRPAVDLTSRLIVGSEVATAPGQPAIAALDGLALIDTLKELKSLYDTESISADQYDTMQLRALAALDPQVTGVEYGLQLLRDFWDQRLITEAPYAARRKDYLDAL